MGCGRQIIKKEGGIEDYKFMIKELVAKRRKKKSVTDRRQRLLIIFSDDRVRVVPWTRSLGFTSAFLFPPLHGEGINKHSHLR